MPAGLHDEAGKDRVCSAGRVCYCRRVWRKGCAARAARRSAHPLKYLSASSSADDSPGNAGRLPHTWTGARVVPGTTSNEEVSITVHPSPGACNWHRSPFMYESRFVQLPASSRRKFWLRPAITITRVRRRQPARRPSPPW